MLRNILSNYLAKVWGIISVFFFVPFYIKYLGIEAYGVINFYTVILSIFYFADGGLSATLNREFSKNTDKEYLGNLLFTFEKVYLAICLFIIVIVSSFSGIIALNWLNSDTISPEDLSIYVSLMGISVAFQLFTTLQGSGLMGLEKQVLSNVIHVTSSIFRSALVLIPLHFNPTISTFLFGRLP
jgi:O-antigen/teichoic acid export membrane protein